MKANRDGRRQIKQNGDDCYYGKGTNCMAWSSTRAYWRSGKIAKRNTEFLARKNIPLWIKILSEYRIQISWKVYKSFIGHTIIKQLKNSEIKDRSSGKVKFVSWSSLQFVQRSMAKIKVFKNPASVSVTQSDVYQLHIFQYMDTTVTSPSG